jgi:hypothetical protein
MKYIILFSALLFSISALAQTCNTDILLQTPSSWKDSPQLSNRHLEMQAAQPST